MEYPDKPMTDALFEDLAQRMKVLGEPMRLRLLHALREGEMSVGAMVAQCETSQPNVSKHLGVLRQAGMVDRRREGNTIFYRIVEHSVFDVCAIMCHDLDERVERQRKRLAGDIG